MDKEYASKKTLDFETQLNLLVGKRNLIKKNLLRYYEQYLNIIRSRINHILKETIYSFFDISSDENNINDEMIFTIIDRDVDLLVNQFLPFLTIEQLVLPIESEINIVTKNERLFNTKLLIDNKSFENSNEAINNTLNHDRTPFLYYESLLEDDFSSSIDLDNSSLKESTMVGYGDENELIYSLLDLSQIDSNSETNDDLFEQKDSTIQISSDLSNLLDWANIIDSSITLQMRRFSFLVNKELFKKKIIKKVIPDNILSLLMDNQSLVSNPLPFILLFDLNANEFINKNQLTREVDFSKIFLFSINPHELEFNDLKLNSIRIKIKEIKQELKILIKKEKYWNVKKINIDLNKSKSN